MYAETETRLVAAWGYDEGYRSGSKRIEELQKQISNLVKLNAIHCTCPYCSKDFDIQPSLNTLIMRSNEMVATHKEEPQGMKWVRAETDTESDGIYLGHISKLEVCGVTNTYQRTVTNRMNKWVLEEGETLTHWMPLPKSPSESSDAGQSSNQPEEGDRGITITKV
jgi:hypothetical protein